MAGLLSPSATAQDALAMDTVEIKASQIPMRIHESGRHITVLKKKQIAAMSAVSVDEILQLVPGVEVQSRGGFGAQADILMRGSTFTQVLILIDGMRLNDPLTGHFNGNVPVPQSEIVRIEVLRGPAAAMYGPDAVGGLINIVTYAWASAQAQESHVSLEAGAGSHRQYQARAGYQSSREKTKLSIGVELNDAEGEFIEPEAADGSQLDAYHNYFKIYTGGASFAYRLDPEFVLRARSSFDLRDVSARYFYTNSPFDKSTEVTGQFFNALQLQRTRDRSTTDWQMAYKRNSDEFVFSPDFPSTNNHKTHFVNLQSNHLWSRGSTTFKVGAQLDFRSISSNDRGDHNDWHTGMYAMMMATPVPDFHLSASGRIDYDANYGLEVLPQLSFSYNLGQIVLRGSAGRSIRAADYTERYVSNNLSNLTPGRSLGNPNLMAERSWTEELGLDLYIGSTAIMQASLFARQSGRLIDYVPTLAEEIGDVGDLQMGEQYFFAKNISNVRTIGIDISIQSNLQLSSTTSWNTTLGYMHANTTNTKDVISVYLANHAKHLVNLNSQLSVGPASFSIGALFKNRDTRLAQSIDATLESSYFLFNCRAGLVLTEELSVQAQVHNLLNIEYQNILGSPMPGRWFLAKLVARF